MRKLPNEVKPNEIKRKWISNKERERKREREITISNMPRIEDLQKNRSRKDRKVSKKFKEFVENRYLTAAIVQSFLYKREPSRNIDFLNV